MTDTRVGHVKADPTDTYVGRGTSGQTLLTTEPGHRGWLGNPFTLEDYHRDDSIERYRRAFEDKLCRDSQFREAVAELAGSTLGCWCQRLEEDSPACHAEVIAEWADRLAADGEAALTEAQRVLPDGGLKPGQQQVDGEVYEYPFRVEDFHGELIRDDLDTIPPFLNQREIDVLASELETRFENGIDDGMSEQTLVEVLRKLPDTEYGRDALPAWIVRESDECEMATDGGRRPDAEEEARWRFEWRNLKNTRRFPL